MRAGVTQAKLSAKCGPNRLCVLTAISEEAGCFIWLWVKNEALVGPQQPQIGGIKSSFFWPTGTSNDVCNTTSVCDVVMDFLTPKMRIKYLHLSAKVCRAGTDYKTHLPTELHYITGGWCGGISCQESQCNLGMGRFTTSFLEKMRPSI